jgi:tRNA nucleotidyltransferase/poly(A) polymerase
MQLREILSIISQVSQRLEVPPVMICGGTVRDKYLHKIDNIADLDLTNGDKSIDYVSEELYNLLRKKYNISREIADDGHSTIFFGNLKMDFSSNFIIPNITEYLNQLGIMHPTNMQKEMFSRDFTCNALLMNLELNYIELVYPRKLL